MTKLILQRTQFDCVIASLAMFLERDYDDILHYAQKLIPDWDPSQPASLSLLWAICNQLGTPVVSSPYFIDKAPQILCVKSRNHPGYSHAIYWNGCQVFDPAGEGHSVDEEYVRKHYIDSTVAIWDFAPVVLETVVRYQLPHQPEIMPR